MKRTMLVTLATAAILLGIPSAVEAKLVQLPLPDPSEFEDRIDNPFFPLEPGTTFYYEGESDGEPMSDVMYVTHDTVEILGVTCVVVHDQVFDADGNLAEDTYDYYAQDEDGNVWYLGEDTEELDPDGNVTSTEGTWRGGVDGAVPGIIMEAHPRKGDRYRQEFLEGEAEDMAQVLSLDAEVSIGLGGFDDLLLTKEWTPLEPDVVEHKYYARGIGFLYSEVVKGGDEQLELVGVTHEKRRGHRDRD